MPKKHYLLIGNGRLARHLRFYFSKIGMSITWLESTPRKFESQQASFWKQSLSVGNRGQLPKSFHRILLALSDDALPLFLDQHYENLKHVFPKAEWVHFSGAWSDPRVECAHPFMSFPKALYSLKFYPTIPFAVFGKKTLKNILPGIPNPSFYISPREKAQYHAFCVTTGNLPIILEQQGLLGLKRLGVPVEASLNFIAQVQNNFQKSPENSLTGPIQRQDFKTMKKNIQALDGNKIQKIFEQFCIEFGGLNK